MQRNCVNTVSVSNKDTGNKHSYTAHVTVRVFVYKVNSKLDLKAPKAHIQLRFRSTAVVGGISNASCKNILQSFELKTTMKAISFMFQ